MAGRRQRAAAAIYEEHEVGVGLAHNMKSSQTRGPGRRTMSGDLCTLCATNAVSGGRWTGGGPCGVSSSADDDEEDDADEEPEEAAEDDGANDVPVSSSVERWCGEVPGTPAVAAPCRPARRAVSRSSRCVLTAERHHRSASGRGITIRGV